MLIFAQKSANTKYYTKVWQCCLLHESLAILIVAQKSGKPYFCTIHSGLSLSLSLLSILPPFLTGWQHKQQEQEATDWPRCSRRGREAVKGGGGIKIIKTEACFYFKEGQESRRRKEGERHGCQVVVVQEPILGGYICLPLLIKKIHFWGGDFCTFTVFSAIWQPWEEEKKCKFFWRTDWPSFPKWKRKTKIRKGRKKNPESAISHFLQFFEKCWIGAETRAATKAKVSLGLLSILPLFLSFEVHESNQNGYFFLVLRPENTLLGY